VFNLYTSQSSKGLLSDIYMIKFHFKEQIPTLANLGVEWQVQMSIKVACFQVRKNPLPTLISGGK
jgi:hypothetical protein